VSIRSLAGALVCAAALATVPVAPASAEISYLCVDLPALYMGGEPQSHPSVPHHICIPWI
jgi:hypothetical protein